MEGSFYCWWCRFGLGVVACLTAGPLFRKVSPRALSHSFSKVMSRLHVFHGKSVLTERNSMYGQLVVLLGNDIQKRVVSCSNELVGIRSVVTPHTVTPLFLFNTSGHCPMRIATGRTARIFRVPGRDMLGLFQQGRGFLRGCVGLSTGCTQALTSGLFFVSFGAVQRGLTSCLLQVLGRRKSDPVRLSHSRRRLTSCFKMSHPSLTHRLTRVRSSNLVGASEGLIRVLEGRSVVRLVRWA